MSARKYTLQSSHRGGRLAPALPVAGSGQEFEGRGAGNGHQGQDAPAGRACLDAGALPGPEEWIGADGVVWRSVFLTLEEAAKMPAPDPGLRRRARASWLVYHRISEHDFPILGVKKYRRDWMVKKRLPDGVHPVTGRGMGGKRAEIKEFSDAARFRLLHVVKNCALDFRSMLTVTYPAEFPTDGRAVKKHLFALKRELLRKFNGLAGVWFLEFQRRGAPHFHIMLNLDLADVGPIVERVRRQRSGERRTFGTVASVHAWVSKAWFRIVGSGDEKHLRAGASWEVIEKEEGALRYAATHAAKPHQKEVPEGFASVGRFWGTLGTVEIPRAPVESITAEELVDLLGPGVISHSGRVKKYLWDATTNLES